ncbi:MAG: hypothetical protein Pg6C_08610 [Treponemataceae bacterium]|nr:MAG: hypothetical protein Pg6C_08610 [Treponemataceae bacterium]
MIRFIRVCIAAGALLLLFSCKTAPQKSFAPFLLMDSKTGIYFLLPARNHEEVSLLAAKRFFSDAGEKELKQIISHISAVYGGFMGRNSQFVITGSFPRVAIKSAFAQKNGWREISSDIAGVKTIYYRHDSANIEVYDGIPNSLLISADVSPMIERFLTGAADYAGEVEAGRGVGVPVWLEMPAGASGNRNNDIRFYITRVSALLEKVSALKLPSDGAFATASAEGWLSKAGSAEADYFLSLDIDLKDRRAVMPAVLLLSLSGAFAGAEITQGQGARVEIKNFPVPQSMIADLLL